METQGRLIVDIARLDKGGENYQGEMAPELLELGKSEFLKPVGGIRYDLFIEILGSELLVRGKLSQRLDCVCSRCGTVFESEARDPEYTESFEIKPETDFMDLTEPVREAIILVLPGYPVCKETCKGLCMKCGANLNNGPCKCEGGSGQSDTRWSALNALSIEVSPVVKSGKKNAPSREKSGRRPTVKEK